MKKFLLVIATFSLVSCLPVEDFGAFWDKAGIDKRLSGTWKWIGGKDDPSGGDCNALFGPRMRIVKKGDAYEMMGYPNGTKMDGELLFELKTLNVGQYQFLAARFPAKQRGMIERYKIKGRVLELCWENIDQFVETNYPHAANIGNSGDVGSVMSIARFDAEAFTILSKIPDTKDYWACEDSYERIR
jgi:hypothetical protein